MFALVTVTTAAATPGTASAMRAHINENTLTVRDGTRLPLRYWPAQTRRRGIVLALHSFTDYSAAFEAICPWFAELGYDCYAYDQRGFGAAPATGRWPGADVLAADLEDAVAAVRARPDGGIAPLFLLGESMGGSVALLTAAQLSPHEPPAGVIVAAPGVREDLPLKPLWDLLLWGADKLLPAASVPVHRSANPRITAATNNRLQHDPLVQRRVRADTYYGVTRLADAASAAASRITSPTLLLYGEEDSLIHRRSICAAQSSISAPTTLKVYDDAPHLVMHWQQQSEVLADIELWLQNPAETNHQTAACSD